MDPISQGALGAVVAASWCKRAEARLAVGVGWAGGMLARAMNRPTPALMDAALDDPRVLRLSEGLEMVESAHANGPFPLKRLARVRLHLVDGRVLQSGWTEPRWDHDAPPNPDELRAKFTALAAPLGQTRAQSIADVVDTLETRPLDDLRTLLARPI